MCRGMSDWRASFLPQMSHIADELADFEGCTCHLSVRDNVPSDGERRSPCLYVSSLVTYGNGCSLKRRTMIHERWKRPTGHRPKEIGGKEGTKKKRPGEGGSRGNPRNIRFMWTPHSSANNPCFCCWERCLNQSENLGVAVSLEPKGRGVSQDTRQCINAEFEEL